MCDIIQDTLNVHIRWLREKLLSVAFAFVVIILVLCAIFLHEDSKKVFDSSHSNFNVELNVIEHQLDSGDIDGVKGGL